MPQIKSFRDLTLIETDRSYLCRACDSGAIGSKEADYLKTTANIVAAAIASLLGCGGRGKTAGHSI